jgi:GDP/UDP-N,N'-diacetylbacillosamine 2-epimerase (hydrolysing)
MMAKKICVVTGTRADYGLLYWVLKALRDDADFELKIVASGMHMSPEFGLTYKEIERDGFAIDKKLEILLSSDSEVGISKAMGLGLIGFSEIFSEMRPDLVFLVGDRFEIFSAACAAMVCRIPIAHCHGGETTQGAIDEAIRHSITKMAHLHFTSTEAYRRRVIQLGERPESVYNVGALGVENIRRLKLMDKDALETSLGFILDGQVNILVTFHPVTIEHASAGVQFQALLEALDALDGTRVIFTKANADTDGRIINQMIDEYVIKHKNCIAFTSMGQLRYLSALQFVDFVIGNSSSGIIEVPSFKKVTINIGDRQMGRLRAESVIDCVPERAAISAAIEKGLNADVQGRLPEMVNPYDNGNASEKIISVLRGINLQGILKKEFNDL